jgi:acetyl esterase/lipase
MILSIVKYAIRRFQRKANWRDIDRVRYVFEKITKKYDRKIKKCRYEPFLIDGMKAEWIVPKNLTPKPPKGFNTSTTVSSSIDTDRVLLYFHGGGYAAGSIATHRSQVSQMVKYSGIKALLIEYRLAPENKFPAPIEDAVKAYDRLLSEGYKPERIAFGGDSAGGGLTVATLLYLRDHSKPLPKCAICLSPWLDLTLSGESQNTKEKLEPLLVKEAFPLWVSNYLGDADPKTPYASPLFADLHGLPPIYIQVGTDELLLDDSVRFAQKAKEAGSPVTIDIYEGYFHVFQAFFIILRTARRANKKLAAFMVEQIGV